MAGKKYRAAAEQIDRSRLYTVGEAVELTKKIAYAKFDETVELDMTLGVDPRKADQMVRGTVVLPHGLGKSKRVVVISSPEKAAEAQEAGADEVGGEDIVNRIKGGWLDFDALIATPDMMRAVRETKAGKVECRVDKTGVIHAPVGKVSFDQERLSENARALIDAVMRAKPSAAKGKYVKNATISSTMGPGIKLNTAEF